MALPDRGAAIAPRVAALLGAELGWDADRQRAEVDAYLASASRRVRRPGPSADLDAEAESGASAGPSTRARRGAVTAQDLVLALDQGTTSSRALVVDRTGSIVASAQQEFLQTFPAPGHVTHDPEDIWQSQLAVARAAIEATPGGVARIAAIGITNQRETTIVWDRTTGPPVAPAIVWQSRITAPACEALRAAGHEERIRALTGLPVDAYFSGPKVAHILDATPGLRERAEAGELCFGTVDSFLLWRLSGGADPCHRRLEREPDAPVRHRAARVGPVALRRDRRPDVDAARGAAVVGPARRDRPGRARRGAAGDGCRGRPAGGHVRPGLPGARSREEHVRDRRVRPAEHRSGAGSSRGTGS